MEGLAHLTSGGARVISCDLGVWRVGSAHTRLRTVHTSSTMHTIDAVDAALTRRHSFGTWLGKLPPYWQKAGAPGVASRAVGCARR